MSFPSGKVWRQRAIISPDSRQRSCASLLAGGADSKFIFLLRDPVDATISTLGRFWKHKERSHDTLIKELAAARMGWRHVVECLRALPCERSLILSLSCSASSRTPTPRASLCLPGHLTEGRAHAGMAPIGAPAQSQHCRVGARELGGCLRASFRLAVQLQ